MESTKNKGYSLVELLVAIAIASIVMLGLAVFMASSSKSYESSNDEIFIQNEAQNTLNLIKNFVMEGKDFKIVKNDSGEKIGLELVNASSKKYNYIIYKKADNMMYFYKCNNVATLVIDPSDPYVVKMEDDEISKACVKKNIMAEYVDGNNGFDINLEKGTYKKSVQDPNDDKKMVDVDVEEINAISVTLKFKRGKSTITQNEYIAPRNSNE